METIICYTSGASRGNPGPSAIGVLITDTDGVVLSEVSRSIGNGTSDFAAYYAVMVGLQTLEELLGTESRMTSIEVRLENKLVKKQLNAESQINDPGLVPLFIEIYNRRVASFPQLAFVTIQPEQTEVVDRLVNEALDGKE